jgi:Flp pilus assembly protein TadG
MFLRDKSGQAIFEIALLLPVLLLLLMGVIEIGRAAYASIIVSNAAHAGALYGAQNPATAADNAGMVQAALKDGQDLSGLTATATHLCTCSAGSSAPNCALSDCPSGRLIEYVQVSTSDVFSPLFHYPGLPSSFNLKGQSVVRVEQ